MSKRILVILGHPSSNSFCGALAERYTQSALRAGHEVRQLFLGKMDFDPVLREGGQAAQRSGTTIKSIRHYESIGLPPAARRQGKYRVYDQHSVDLLIFIKCAQHLGFRLKELQMIFSGHQGLAMPWSLAQQAIDAKKCEISERIAALTHQHEQLVEFEASLTQARADCPLESL
ncbi:MerR family transcriptional regulator [Pseudomonas sp. MDT1-85]